MEHADNDRYTRGWDKLKEIDGTPANRCSPRSRRSRRISRVC